MKAAGFLALMIAIGAAGQQPSGRVREEMADAPAQLTASARIAPVSEAGEPLVIEGIVFGEDGKTPVPGVVVYAYHADHTGHYRNDGASEGSSENTPRLRGWAKTDSRGHFEWVTIKPAPYPNRNVPAHIHVTVWGAGYPVQWFQVEFAGDPLLPKQHFTDNSGDFTYIVPVEEQQGALRGKVELRLRRRSNFPGQ